MDKKEICLESQKDSKENEPNEKPSPSMMPVLLLTLLFLSKDICELVILKFENRNFELKALMCLTSYVLIFVSLMLTRVIDKLMPI